MANGWFMRLAHSSEGSASPRREREATAWRPLRGLAAGWMVQTRRAGGSCDDAKAGGWDVQRHHLREQTQQHPTALWPTEGNHPCQSVERAAYDLHRGATGYVCSWG